ncbi:cytochrome b [Marimonas lutisalis]|uniref:cytochrome b n=1 Tax=Marimonas lutisalis TaxID=2545756 RepID=UPI0013758329|nr:cytochrome b/b6 domain-containing protein [Marimonas lutisalis]
MPIPYTRAQIRLHWLVFILIALQYVLHEPMSEAWDVIEDGGSVAFDPLVFVHVAGGMLILLLVVLRIGLRLRVGAPPLPAEEPAAMKMLAHVTHLGLYVLMIGMPVSGAVAWFGGAEAAAEAHEVMRAILLALVALHVVGALYHQFVLKTNLMNRMRTPGRAG